MAVDAWEDEEGWDLLRCVAALLGDLCAVHTLLVPSPVLDGNLTAFTSGVDFTAWSEQ